MPIHLGNFSHLKMRQKRDDIAEDLIFSISSQSTLYMLPSSYISEYELFLRFLFLPYKTSYYCSRRQFIIDIFFVSAT